MQIIILLSKKIYATIKEIYKIANLTLSTLNIRKGIIISIKYPFKALIKCIQPSWSTAYYKLSI